MDKSGVNSRANLSLYLSIVFIVLFIVVLIYFSRKQLPIEDIELSAPREIELRTVDTLTVEEIEDIQEQLRSIEAYLFRKARSSNIIPPLEFNAAFDKADEEVEKLQQLILQQEKQVPRRRTPLAEQNAKIKQMDEESKENLEEIREKLEQLEN